MSGAVFRHIRAIVTDIEGTTTSISFVFDTLFPYAREHLPAFVEQNAHHPAVREQLRTVAEAEGRELSDEEAVAVLLRWIDEDRKVTPLKSLQGMVWGEGYAAGTLRGHIYDDAVEALRNWRAEGMSLYIYSSGSVQAQKLIFGHTEFGDLTTLFSGYFDTTTGPKREADSYRSIAAEIGEDAAQILFLSDVEAELDAARAAGLKTCWLVREAEPDPDAAHPQVSSFADIRVRATEG